MAATNVLHDPKAGDDDLSYVREWTGHALIGARQWIPVEHITDPVTSIGMGLPPGLQFRTKGQLAIDICADAYADGLAFDFARGDEVYGSCTQLRDFFEQRGQAYVLRVASTFAITLAVAAVPPSGSPGAVRIVLGQRDRGLVPLLPLSGVVTGDQEDCFTAWIEREQAAGISPPAEGVSVLRDGCRRDCSTVTTVVDASVEVPALGQ